MSSSKSKGVCSEKRSEGHREFYITSAPVFLLRAVPSFPDPNGGPQTCIRKRGNSGTGYGIFTAVL